MSDFSDLNRPGDSPEKVASPSRRRALTKLGLAASAAYVAPTLLRLDRQAHAAPTPCPSPYWPGPRPASCPKKKD